MFSKIFSKLFVVNKMCVYLQQTKVIKQWI